MPNQIPEHMRNLDFMIRRAQTWQRLSGNDYRETELWGWIEFVGVRLRELEQHDDR